jgi:hypothetical protein
MNPWRWYVATDLELMLDIDGSPGNNSNLGKTRLRLEAAIESGLLKIDGDYLWLYRSETPDHYHVVIKLKAPGLSPSERFVWEMQLRSDLYRGRCNLMRVIFGRTNPGLLITRRLWTGFYRDADDSCECPEKHDFEMMGTCPAALRLRGAYAAEGFFGKLKTYRRVLPLKCREGLIPVKAFASSVESRG